MQIFPRTLNKLPLIAGASSALALPVVVFLAWYYFSPWYTQVGYRPPHCVDERDCPAGSQPVAYKHSLHVGTLGMDCRYCHVNVEKGPVAMVPPTETCMNCHALVKTDSARLAPVRESWETGKPIAWTRIHKLPDYVYFDHSVHVTGGVECHGRIDQMDVVRQEKPLSMAWCLECHREVKDAERNHTVSPRIRPKDVEVTKMDWDPASRPADAKYRREHLNPPENCSGCHR